jgi:hypothetical protein
MTYFILASVLFLVANYCDFELQAFQHGWNALLDLSARSPKWGIFDFIPHDLWHIIQWLRNLTMIAGTTLAIKSFWWVLHVFSYSDYVCMSPAKWKNWACDHKYIVGFVSAIVLYVVTRGVGFSLMYKLLNGF